MAAISCPLIRVTRLRLAAREGRPLWTSIFGPPGSRIEALAGAEDGGRVVAHRAEAPEKAAPKRG